jgi:hypothetical protein
VRATNPAESHAHEIVHTETKRMSVGSRRTSDLHPIRKNQLELNEELNPCECVFTEQIPLVSESTTNAKPDYDLSSFTTADERSLGLINQTMGTTMTKNHD